MKHIYEAVGSVFKFVAGNKNGTKNGVNGNGVNGNGLDPKLYSSADLHMIDRVYQSASKTLDRIRNYKPPEPEVRKELLYRPEQAQIDEALRQQHTYHHLIQNPPRSLDDITQWSSEYKVGTKEHYRDFLATMKYFFPGRQGSERFVNFADLREKYKTLAPSKLNVDKLHPSVDKTFGDAHKLAGGRTIGLRGKGTRRKTNKKSGEARIAKQAWSSDEDRAYFKQLEKERTAGNKKLGVKSGNAGYTLEHNIGAFSRYWEMHTTFKNSDKHNVFVWHNVPWKAFKEDVEKHIRKLAGEPFAVKMNGTLDRLQIIHIDSGEVISEMKLNEDYRTVFKQLVELFT